MRVHPSHPRDSFTVGLYVKCSILDTMRTLLFTASIMAGMDTVDMTSAPVMMFSSAAEELSACLNMLKPWSIACSRYGSA